MRGRRHFFGLNLIFARSRLLSQTRKLFIASAARDDAFEAAAVYFNFSCTFYIGLCSIYLYFIFSLLIHCKCKPNGMCLKRAMHNMEWSKEWKMSRVLCIYANVQFKVSKTA